MTPVRSLLFAAGCLFLAAIHMQGQPANLPFGQVTTGTISSAAQSNSYTFSANANDVVDFTMVATSGNLSSKLRLYNSAGTLLSSANPGNCFGSNIELNTVALPTTGTYTVLVGDCSDTNTGNYAIYMQRTNNPAGATELLFGQITSGMIGSAAQSNSYTFVANANDVLDFTMVVTSGNLSSKLRLYNPDGTLLSSANPGNCFGSNIEMNNVQLPTSGTYTLLVGDCSDTNTGNYLIYVQRTNNPVGASALIFGGQPQTGMIGSATQSNSYTFGGSANDVLDFTMVVTSGNLSSKLRLYNPNGTLLSSANPGNCFGSNIEMNNVQLPTSGTYTLLVGDCSDTNTGNYSLSAQCFGVCTSSASTPTPQTITFGPLNNQVLGTAPITLSATASSGLAVTFTSNTPSVCTVSGAAVTLVATGTCSITASQSGNSTYAPATPVTQTFTITQRTQASSCAYALAPATQVIPAAAGTGTVGVLTTAGCPWTASTETSFLTIASGSSGNGPGVVQFAATANTAPAARAGTLMIAGETATINQTGTAPLLLLSPSSIAVQWTQQSPLPIPIPLSVFTTANSLAYTATASSTGNWLSVSPGSGNAPATVIVTVNPSSLAPGPYQGTVTINAPAANPSTQTFTVSLTVVAAGPPTLSVATKSLSYSFAQGVQQVEQQRIPVGNSGGGTLSYEASASTNSGGNWLTVSQDGAGATPSTPDLLTVTVDPSALAVGTYTGLITITANTTQTIPVTVTISAVQQTILLSETGLTFTAVANGGIVPPQTFGILNSGTGSMDWSVSSSTVTGGSNWLSVTPDSGTTDASSLNVPLVTVSVNPATLAPGLYSGQIKVTSSTANNTPEFVSVILTVLPAGSNPGPLVLPTGLIFTQGAGGTPAASQTISVSNLTASQQTFTTGTLTLDGANWFSVTPATGIATPTQATTLTVSVNSAGLSPGIRQGVLTLLFQDGSVRTVNILFVLATGGVSSQTRSGSQPSAAAASCTPTKLLPLLTSLGSQFTVPAAWPNTLEVQVVDDCGNPQISGTVVASFSNGDPPLPLISLKNGSWTGTWQVTNSSNPVIAVTVNADNPSLDISGAISVSGTLQSSANAPVIRADGVLNGASYSPAAPLAPGSLVSIFGSNLGNGTSTATAFPLPSQLSGALVIIGGEPAPLLYAGRGQINAVIPFGLPVNTNTQVIVRQGEAYTSPTPITLSAASPGILTMLATGTGQGVIVDGVNIAQPGTPAKAGDEIVIYAVGLGATTPPATTGQAATGSPLLKVTGAVSLTIGGQGAHVDFAGLAPGFAGLYQVNAAVPAGVQGDALPVVLTVEGQPSPPVTMAVQ